MAIPLFFSVAAIIRQKVIQFQRRERLEHEWLQTITVPAEKIHWIKKGKEMLVDGRLFDVESYHIQNGRISATGFFDGKEEEVIRDIRDLVQQKGDYGSPLNGVSFAKFFFTAVYTEPGGISFQSPWHMVERKGYVYAEVIPDPAHSADTPPPKYC